MSTFDPKIVWQDDVQTALINVVSEAMSMAVDMQVMIGQDNFIDVKADNTLVTKADKAVEKYIKNGLENLTKDVFFLGEETAQTVMSHNKKLPDVFWICDPIDGTSGYALGKHDFAITLALVVNGRPLFGMIALPYYREIVYTKSNTQVCFISLNDKNIKCLTRDKDQKNQDRLIIGPSRLNAINIYKSIFNKAPQSVTQRASALKFVELLKGQADVYIREKQLCEWDVAAGDALLHAYGGSMISYETNQVLRYGIIKDEFKVKAILAKA